MQAIQPDTVHDWVAMARVEVEAVEKEAIAAE